MCRPVLALLIIALLSGCSSTPDQPSPLEAYSNWAEPAQNTIEAHDIALLYEARSWGDPDSLAEDPVDIASQLASPINHAYINVIGTGQNEALRSLATKLWMIDNAEHTLDLTYYIFKYDQAGKALLGALCHAVERGVDIRIMVDSLGSMHFTHQPMLALQTCAENAGYIKDREGRSLPLKARVQFVIINSLMSKRSWSNRRSHDKLIIKDGHFAGKDMVMTGGRNISLDYYGIDAKGNPDPDSFRDLEIVLRSRTQSHKSEEFTIGDISSFYYSLLFLHEGNCPRTPMPDAVSYKPGRAPSYDRYQPLRTSLREAYAALMQIPALQPLYAGVNTSLEHDYLASNARLAHDLINLTSTDVVTSADEIKASNANSIEGILDEALKQIEQFRGDPGKLYVVSPYLFIPRYKNKRGDVTRDGAQNTLAALEKHPNTEIHIITNSVLTSDNFFTQSVIDMDTAPRLLLDPASYAAWLDTEHNPALTESALWRKLINHPRIHIYQTGTLDADLIGGNTVFGKLHAKFLFTDLFGFVGTSNFDYRSRLYNSEMGFYFDSPEVIKALHKEFDFLKSQSLRWGTPEWLEMRQKIIQAGGMKGYSTKQQRLLYKTMKGTGLIWLF